MDIFLTFFTAIEDKDKKTIDNLKSIAFRYIKAWFFIDVCSIIPISQLIHIYDPSMNTNGFNRLIRLLRVGKIYRLMNLAK